MLVNEEVSFDHNCPGDWVEELMPPQLTKTVVHRVVLPSGGTSQEHSVDIDKYYENTRQGGVLKYLRRKLLPPH